MFMFNSTATSCTDWFIWPSQEEFRSLREELLDFMNVRDEDAEICVLLHLAVRRKVVINGGETISSLPDFSSLPNCTDFVNEMTLTAPAFIKIRVSDLTARRDDCRLQQSVGIFIEQFEAWTHGY
jgi:hypothetical protein